MAPPPHLIIHYEDLMVEILSRLPVKSLVRLKCVSKSFKSLISHPSFVKLHLQRSPKNANLLLRLHDPLKPCFSRFSSISLLKNSSFTVAEDMGFDRQFESQYEFVIGSCNGLVCLLYGFRRFSAEDYRVCLWNPATKLTSQGSPRLVIGSKQCCNFGFGYDSLSDTYKVVAILKHSLSLQTEMKVYTKGDKYWRNVPSFPSFPILTPAGVYLNGTLSWIVVKSEDCRDFPASLSIVSLDLGEETYRELLLPWGSDEVHHVDEFPRIGPSIGVLKDCLCFSHNFERTNFVVWQMKEYGVEHSWTKLFNISYQDLQIDSKQHGYHLLQLCTLENGGIMIIATYGRLTAILYNPINNKVEHTEISNDIFGAHATVYVQSLVSPR